MRRRALVYPLTEAMIDDICRWTDDPLCEWWLWERLSQVRNAQQAWLRRRWWQKLADWARRR